MIRKVLIIPYKKDKGKIYYFVGLGKSKSVWRFPTGHVGDKKNNKDESSDLGAKRELSEELGVGESCKTLKTNLSQIFSQEHSDESKSGEVKESVYVADITGEKIKIEENEFSDYKFLPYNRALSTLFYNSHKKFLRDVNTSIQKKLS